MATKIGFAAGTLSSDGAWLTVWGAAHNAERVLFAERPAAEERAAHLRARTVEHARDRVAVRRVEWIGGTAYRVVPDDTPAPAPRMYRYEAAQRGTFSAYELCSARWATVHPETGAVRLHNVWADPSALAENGEDVFRIVD